MGLGIGLAHLELSGVDDEKVASLTLTLPLPLPLTLALILTLTLALTGVDDEEVVGRVALPEHHLPLAILPALLDAVHHRLEHLHHIGEI